MKQALSILGALAFALALVVFLFGLLFVQGCASSPSAPPLLPVASFEVVQGECGPEYVAVLEVKNDIAVGETGYSLEHTATTTQRLHKRCEPAPSPASQPRKE